MPLLQKDIRKRPPLVLRWVHPSGVVRACVQEEHRALRGGLECIEEAGKVESDGCGVVVRVGKRVNADIAEDCEVVYCVGRP